MLRASQRRLAEQEAEAKAVRSVEKLTGSRAPTSIGDVYRELLDTAGLAIVWKDVLRDRVDALSDLTSATALGGEQVRGDVLLFERAMDRAVKVLEVVARLDLDSRIAYLSAQQGEAVVRVLRAAMGSVDLTDPQRAAMDAALARELRKLTEGSL